jgi:hypothetical protein
LAFGGVSRGRIISYSSNYNLPPERPSTPGLAAQIVPLFTGKKLLEYIKKIFLLGIEEDKVA